MNKDEFMGECQRQLMQYFSVLKQGKMDTELKNRIQGFINAGEFLQLINRQEASQLMEQTHFNVFGMTNEQRKLNKQKLKSALKGENDDFLEIPAINRKKV